MTFEPTQISAQIAAIFATEIGVGGVTGFMVGYGLRKIASFAFKAAAIATALFMIPLTALEAAGIIKLDFAKLTSFLEGILASFTAFIVTVTPTLIKAYPATGSFGLGLVLGASRK